jgi:ribosomal protein S18 acetylase RimI-like enzyme
VKEAASQRAEANLCRAIEMWGWASEGGETTRSAALTAAHSTVPIRSFNQILIMAPIAADLEELRSALRLYEGPGRRFRVRMRSELAGDAADALLAAGLVDRGGIPCLVASDLDGDSQGNPAIEIRSVEDEASLLDHVIVVAEAFGWEVADLARVFTPKLLDDPDWRGYTGYAESEPVATSQLVVHERVAGLYYIGTRELWRGKGFGEALTRHAMRQGAAAGCDIASLQASPAGYPIYVRIGFRDVAYYKTYASP